MRQLDVSIVMPCLNERESLPVCIARAKQALAELESKHSMSGEIVIADNGSTDGSQQIAQDLGARVVPVPIRGYGAALIEGCSNALGKYVLMGDSDGSYDFLEGVAMVAKLDEGYDLCMGSRFRGGIAPGAMPWKNRYIGNPALTGILNLFFRTGMGDAHCGLRAIRKDAFKRLNLSGTGMEFASEMVIKASLLDLRMAEVPATLSPDLRNREPHLRPWRDGWRHLRYLFMLSPTWLFGVPSFLALCLATVIFLMGTLHFFNILPGEPFFGVSWSIVAGFAMTCGHLGLLLAFATHLHGARLGYRRLRPAIAKYANWLTLETMLLSGLGLMVVGLAGLGFMGYIWGREGFFALDNPLPLIVFATTAAIGFQNVFGGFLLSIIAGNESRFVPD